MKELVLTNEDYELTKMLVSNMIFFYEKDLSKYESLLAKKDFEQTTNVSEDKVIVLNEEVLLEEIEFLKLEIIRTKELLETLSK